MTQFYASISSKFMDKATRQLTRALRQYIQYLIPKGKTAHITMTSGEVKVSLTPTPTIQRIEK